MENNNTLATLAGLLKQPTTVTTSDTKGATSKCEAELNQRCTVFDISEGDRYRILKLIEELLDAQDDADKLKQKLHEERSVFREKRSSLMKKLDQLSEKHEKTLVDMQTLKERYASNLKSLEEKISTVSDSLEVSAMEIRELRKANEDLLQENATLKKLNKENAVVIASCQEENSRMHLQLDVQKEKEKCYKKQLKRVVSEFKSGAGDNYRFGSSSTSNTEQMVPHTYSISNQKKDIVDKRSGAGDFITDKVSSTSTSSLETIKAPTKVTFDSSNHPTLLPGNSETKAVVEVVSLTGTPKYSLDRDYANDFEDTILLESLFFRF